MKILTAKPEESTYVFPDEVSDYDLRRAVISRGETTSIIEESSDLTEIPSMLVLEQQFDVVTDQESLVFLALKDIQEVVEGRFTEWKEDEHLGEKFLFETRKRNRRV